MVGTKDIPAKNDICSIGDLSICVFISMPESVLARAIE